MEEAGEPRESPNDKKIQEKRAKSCKGCLYYSSTFKSDSRSPLCVGLTRSLPRVPNHIVGESEMEASREGRSLADFKYACVGYSVYSDGKDPSIETKSELPVCVGLEILVDKRANTTDSVPAPVHNKEDAHAIPHPRPQKPAHSIGDEFLSRFSRNASIVAMGVAKNLRKVGNHVKERLDDILNRRPK